MTQIEKVRMYSTVQKSQALPFFSVITAVDVSFRNSVLSSQYKATF